MRTVYLNGEYFGATLGNECWNWMGYKNKYRYGRYGADGVLAHRAVYESLVGQIPDGMSLLCHHCDNPSCVRPSHLFPGTQADNTHDCIKKNRHCHGEQHWSKHENLKGENACFVVLSERQVIAIRERYSLSARKRGLQAAMAREFGVTPQTICDILKRRSWQHV